MKQEDKEWLLKDLCARLPLYFNTCESLTTLTPYTLCTLITETLYKGIFIGSTQRYVQINTLPLWNTRNCKTKAQWLLCLRL